MNRFWCVLLFFNFLLSGCSWFQDDFRGEDADEIVIGLAGPWDHLDRQGIQLLQGIMLAVDEVNTAGGVLEKKMKVIRKDDEESVEKARWIATEFVDNEDLIAVIGHYNSFISKATSPIYEFSGILTISPTATDPSITDQGFQYVFRNIPNDRDMGIKLSTFCKNQGYERVMLYYVKNDLGRKMANVFEKHVEDEGVFVVDRLSYSEVSERNFRRVLNDWQEQEFDAIVLIGTMPQAASFIKQAREIGIVTPIIGNLELDTPELLEETESNGEGTIIISTFHPENPRIESQIFVKAYQEKYQKRPDHWAAQGYDAVKLLMQTLQTADTVDPKKLADTLRKTKNWKGVTGEQSFAPSGDVLKKSVVMKRIRKNNFEFLVEF